nr:MAG TPA: hypothetical protein [Caudoviricetes sp.]
MSYIPEPVTRTDKYLAYIAGNMDVTLPDYPITRKEHYLAAWAEKSGFEDVEITGDPPLTLEDAIGKPLKGLKVYGRSKQVTTTGAQLLDLKDEHIIARDGVTIKILDNGCLFVDGTPLFAYMGVYSENLALSPGKYYFSSDDNGPGSVYGQIFIEKEDGSSSYYYNKNFKVDGTEKSIRLTIQNGNNMEHIDNYVLHLMLSKGSTPLPWEPYTGGLPSPSPNYPQEIESVGTKWSTGANLLDISKWNTYEKTYGLAITIKNDIVTLRGTYERSNFDTGKKVQAMFRFLRMSTITRLPDNAKVAAQIIKGDGVEGIYVSSSLKENTPCIVIAFYAVVGDEVEIQLKPMIYIGDTVPEWEPYTGGVPKPYGDKIGINVRGKNLLPTTMYSDSGTINGVKFTNNGDGSITAVGTATDMTYFTLYGYNTLGYRGTLPSMEPGDALYISDCLLQQTNSQSIISIDENKSTSFYKSTTTMYAAIRVSKGKNVNKTFFPMISKGSKPIPYEPYHEPQFASIATPNGLPGVPVSSGGNYTDADGQQWICDEIDFGRGVYVQRVAYTTVDEDKIIFKETGNYWNLPRYSSPGCIYAYNHINNFFSSSAFRSNNNHSFIFTTPEWMKEYFETVDKLNEFCKRKYDAGTPLTLYYALTTHIETPLTADQLNAYKALRTYKGTTIIDNDAGAYMSVRYEKMK